MRKSFLVPFLALLLPVALAYPSPREVGGAEDARAPGAGRRTPVETTLVELRAAPARNLGEPVRFVLQFHELVADWNPWLSRFGPRDWVAVSCWPDEEFTWDREVFSDPLTTLFARKGTSAAATLLEAETYGRFEVLAVVREVFGGRPWIEIEAIVPLEEHVGEGAILHVGRAGSLIEEGRIELAIDQLERAKSAPLPAHARRELERRIVECHRIIEAQVERALRRR